MCILVNLGSTLTIPFCFLFICHLGLAEKERGKTFHSSSKPSFRTHTANLLFVCHLGLPDKERGVKPNRLSLSFKTLSQDTHSKPFRTNHCCFSGQNPSP
ncbi:hypothetical protein Hanom_Chr07g00585721 [Helianthus anomalus]